jgi:hypothetical protein
MAIAYTLISSTTLSNSTTPVVSFTSIPTTYQDLIVRGSIATTSGAPWASFWMFFNGDTSAGTYTTYSGNQIYGDGNGSKIANQQASASYNTITQEINGAGATNVFGNIELYFGNYNLTTAKPFTTFGVSENNDATAYLGVSAQQYRGNAGLTTISFDQSVNGTNWLSGSSFYLYGISSTV